MTNITPSTRRCRHRLGLDKETGKQLHWHTGELRFEVRFAVVMRDGQFGPEFECEIMLNCDVRILGAHVKEGCWMYHAFSQRSDAEQFILNSAAQHQPHT